MRKWRYFGPDTELTPLAQMIMSEDTSGLAATLGRDWQLNEKIHFCKHCDDLAINLALIEDKQKVVDFLIEQGVDLNAAKSPAITSAARNSDKATIEKILAAGADIAALNNVGGNAYSCALYSDRFDLLPFLLAKGLAVDADGGVSFRQAVYGQQREAVEFFLRAGIDPNIRRPDMVFPYSPTAVHVAVQKNDFGLVRLLVEHGADVTLADADGVRPYLSAALNKNVEMQEYIRALEPTEWHDPRTKIALLQSYGAPQGLIEFVQRENRRIEINAEYCEWIELLSLLNIYELKWPGGPYLALLANVDDHASCGLLAWSKRRKKLAIIDQEHDETFALGTWEKFVANPEAELAKQWK
jgi:uncharacterized protein